MSTQKTGMGGGSIPPKSQEPEEQDAAVTTTDDLGIPEDVYIDDDPTGYVPDVPVEEVGGRRVRRITGTHLEEAHSRYAGQNVRMDGQLKEGPPSTDRPTGQQAPHQPTATTATEAQRLMPDAYKGQQQSAPAPQYAGPTANEPATPPVISTPVDDSAAAKLRIGKKEADAAAMSFEYLSEAELRAVRAGDYGAAAQAKLLAEQLAEEYTVKQRSEMKQEHPALTKLLTNLGLKKIKRTSIPWGGSDWLFAPTNAELDYWVARSMDAAGMNVNALSISAGLVGLDDVPLYKVLNVPLKKTHVVTNNDSEDDEDGQECRIVIYKKYCHCGNQIEVEVENCPICDAAQDIFDVPLDLRMVCAQRFNEVLSTQFGAYESLGQLVDLRAEQMKDRRFDAEELYPLVTPSSKEETTQD